jgi:peptidoglycan/LPS O-acetylase OafA/YrhL
MVLLSPQNSGWVKFGSFGCFDQIASGALLYFIVRKYKKFFQLHAWLCVLACFSGGGILMGTYGWTHSLGHPMDTVYGASFIALGSFLFLLGGLHLSLFQSKFLTPLAWPGKYSYGIYLLHAFVFYYAYPLLIFHANVLIAFSLFIAISTVVAALSYHLFEVPTNRMIRGIFGLKLT